LHIMGESACELFAMCQLICQEFVKTPLLGICKRQVRARCCARGSADTCFPKRM
jgi:hypothetical protein